jgi:hypothetical protein
MPCLVVADELRTALCTFHAGCERLAKDTPSKTQKHKPKNIIVVFKRQRLPQLVEMVEERKKLLPRVKIIALDATHVQVKL